MDPVDVVYMVRKRGWSLAQIAKDAGLSRATLSAALRQPCLGGEKAILAFLKVSGHQIWPDRYTKDGRRVVKRGPGPSRGKAA